MHTASSHAIIRWLPHLRRYAHALTGERALGDTYVRACLEVAVEEPDRFSGVGDTRLRLFKLFHDIWTIVDDGCGRIDATQTSEAELLQHVADLPSFDRQVFLLSSLESFSVEDIAWIVDEDEDAVAHRLSAARLRLRQANGARVLIIEDRPLVAANMRDMVGSLGHTVVGVARREGEAVELAAAHPPEVVLADIELGAGNGRIDAVQRVVGSVHAPAVVVTASPDFLWHHSGALEAAVIVPKPFDRRALQLAIGQALSVIHDRTRAH